MLFLSLLDAPGATRGSRRTRDDRTPFVRQVQLAEWLAPPQPHISLWLRYGHRGDWANLLSQSTPEVLTAEWVDRIVEVYATFPTWGWLGCTHTCASVATGAQTQGHSIANVILSKHRLLHPHRGFMPICAGCQQPIVGSSCQALAARSASISATIASQSATSFCCSARSPSVTPTSISWTST